jgi:hypothetical protein
MHSSTSLPRLSLACALACLVLGACSSIPRIPATGEFAGQRVATTVDAEVARYYLERYSQGRHENHEMDERIAAIHRSQGDALPSRDELKAISVAFSVDFAALYFADRLLQDACNKTLNRLFARYLEQDARVDSTISAAYQILFVPGWDYVSSGGLTGSDFARPRELATRAGFENHLLKLPPTGSVEAGALVVAAEISRLRRSGKKILLAGTSSAGPAIHLALGELLDDTDRGAVKVWLNLGGILRGTPLVDYFEALPQRVMLDFYAWAKGWDRQAIPSMGTVASQKRFLRLQLNSDLVVINYLGIPLSGQLSQYGGTGYRMLRSDGPNDGLVLVTDVIAPDSLTVVALGSDHFFAEDPQIDRKTVALMRLVVAYANQEAAVACAGTGNLALRRARR